MNRRSKRHRATKHQSPVDREGLPSEPPAATSSPPNNEKSPERKPSRLSAWGQVLTPIATILTLVFAAYQAWLTQKKEELAVLTLNTAERASALAMQNSNLTERAKADLRLLAKKQHELESLTQISTLSIRAENGDRSALAGLFALAPDAKASWIENGPVSLTKKNLDRIAHKFNTMTINDSAFLNQISSIFTDGDTPDSIAANLNHTNYVTRAQAAFTASFLRVNKLIPVLYESARNEPDMHALTVMCLSLNQMLDPDNKPFFPSQFVFYPQWASNEYSRLWLSSQDTLLAQSPKKWIHVEPKPGSPWNTILIDPDTQDDRTGEPKGR